MPEQFKQVLETINLDKTSGNSLKFLCDPLNNKVVPKLASRSFIIYGEPGVGKTHLCENLLEQTDNFVVYSGVAHLKRENFIKIGVT